MKKVSISNKDRRVSTLVNLTPDLAVNFSKKFVTLLTTLFTSSTFSTEFVPNEMCQLCLA